MPLLLSLDRCDVRYGAIHALKQVTLSVSAGEIVGVVGPLGAGKTTLLRLVVGLVPLHRGSMGFAGDEIVALDWDARARRGIVLVPADGGLFPSLTVQENLMLAEAPNADGARRARLASAFPVLGDRLAQRAGSLSGGEQRQLALARGVLAEPRILLLDEPLLGLAPRTATAVLDLLRLLRDEGIAVVVAEERPGPDLAATADRLVGLRDGRLVQHAQIEAATPPRPAGAGARDRVELETLALPLATRDRRALQTIAAATGKPVGEVIAGLVREHVDAHQEVWR